MTSWFCLVERLMGSIKARDIYIEFPHHEIEKVHIFRQWWAFWLCNHWDQNETVTLKCMQSFNYIHSLFHSLFAFGFGFELLCLAVWWDRVHGILCFWWDLSVSDASVHSGIHNSSSSLKTSEPISVAAVNNSAVTLPLPCFVDEVILLWSMNTFFTSSVSTFHLCAI